MTNFWKEINKPIFALAPMEDVTDTVFREVIQSVSDPNVLNVLFTEFTSTDGLCNETGFKSVSTRLEISVYEHQLLKQTNTKLVAQIWGSKPENFLKSAQILTEMHRFDGIDINMGCPVKKVIKSKSCSALINYPDLAREIIVATKEGTNLPVSVKTRIGFNEVITEKWISELLDEKPAAITIHGRTQKMLSNGQAMWNEIGKAVQLRNNRQSETLIIGNGDITNYETAMQHVQDFKVDGVMIGTGIFKSPWLFNKACKPISVENRFNLLKKHIELFDGYWGSRQNYNILKRFYKIYINGFEGAAEWRDKLMHTKNCEEAIIIVGVFEKNSKNISFNNLNTLAE